MTRGYRTYMSNWKERKSAHAPTHHQAGNSRNKRRTPPPRTAVMTVVIASPTTWSRSQSRGVVSLKSKTSSITNVLKRSKGTETSDVTRTSPRKKATPRRRKGQPAASTASTAAAKTPEYRTRRRPPRPTHERSSDSPARDRV